MAYNQHHHLRLRPDDIRFAILSQLGFYINAHAEDLRSLFVAHNEKKELILVYSAGSRYTFDFGGLHKTWATSLMIILLIKKLKAWMTPAFSTTEDTEIVVASILLMGATQKYFDFRCVPRCGIPYVTLLGEKCDWKEILRRLEKLKGFGEETTRFYTLFKPIVSRFVRSFENSAGEEVVSFWQRIAHFTEGGSGPSYYSGWIPAFCFWDARGGVCMGRPISGRGILVRMMDVKMGSVRGMGMRSGRMNPVLS